MEQFDVPTSICSTGCLDVSESPALVGAAIARCGGVHQNLGVADRQRARRPHSRRVVVGRDVEAALDDPVGPSDAGRVVGELTGNEFGERHESAGHPATVPTPSTPATSRRPENSG